MKSPDNFTEEHLSGDDWFDPHPDHGIGESIVEELESLDAVLVGSVMFSALSSLFRSVIKLLTKG